MDVPSVGEIYNQAIRLQSNGSHQEALQTFRRILEIDSQFMPALLGVADVLVDLGRLEDAEEAYRECINLSALPGALYNLGQLLVRQGRFKEAASFFARAALEYSNDEDVADSFTAEGFALAEAGRLTEAIVSFKRATVFGRNWKAYYNLGTTLREIGNVDEAIESYERALDISPNQPLLLYNLGNALRAAGRKPEAVLAYRKALELKPSFAEARSNLKLTISELKKPFKHSP